jgi:glycosyltransferase involved in cell wall biosynthesis
MGNPTVSVIMAAYNHADYISQAINTVLAQSWQDLELIVIDDGSSDRTREVVAGFGDPVRYIYQENQGQGGARNTGIAHALGEFVCFLDDDDAWEPNYLDTVLTTLRPRPDVAALYAACQMMDGGGNRLPRIMDRVVPPEKMYDALVEGGWFPPLVVTVRKACLDAVGPLDPSLRGTDDWDLWLRVARNYRFMGISDVIALYRIHATGLSANVEHMLRDHKRAIAKNFGPEEGEPVSWPLDRRRAYAATYRLAGTAYLEAGDAEHARPLLRRCFLTYPGYAQRLDVLYEMACGVQLRGFRGDFRTIDLARSEHLLLELLQYIFDPSDTPSGLQGLRARAFGRGYLALAMLAYGGDRLAESRRYMIAAVRYDPHLFFDRRLTSRFAKSLVGRQALEMFRRHRVQRANDAQRERHGA